MKLVKNVRTHDAAYTSEQTRIDRTFRICETAREIGCSEWTLRDWDASGRLPALRDRYGSRLYRSADIETGKTMFRRPGVVKS